MLPWIFAGICATFGLWSAIRLYLLRRELAQMARQMEELLAQDTNSLIFVSSRDRYVCWLASEFNCHLRTLRRQRRRYLEGDRELKEAVTNISHDLRTPLTAVCGYLELLEDEQKSEEARRYLARIDGCVDTMRQLTEELFRYSVVASVGELAREDVVLNRALEEALLSDYGAFAARGIVPGISITERPVHCLLDASALSRIFGNVLSNVLKYSDGDLEVMLDEDGTVTFSNRAKNLTATQVARLFDRFYTVETGRAATGLGLSIAKVLTERMGGTIAAGYDGERLSIRIHFERKY